ncbi:tripartite tricarboxylate transporter substrate binding protein [Aquabacter sp. CN5-332]|uniref:Bug family tripartite tricarboxylate transporter substrate binding protein n=1 Tax=Aquabacter sp. CN5-332 TaxID=3156608 RepID=UPI0032B52DB1
MSSIKFVCAALLGVAMSTSCFAAGYPDRPVTVIVPFPAGGASDSAARFITPKMSEVLGQPVVVDNKPGANGGTGAQQMAKSPADGYTLLVGSIGVFAINPALYPNLAYSPQKDFDLLTVAVRTPNVLVATPNFPANSVKELIDYMKKNPNKVTFASSGIGSSDHLTAALFWQKTGTQGVHVPYKGGGPAINDLMGGHADVSFQNLGSVANQIRAGKLKLLAVTAADRASVFPDTPTMKEAGVPGLEVYSWQAAAGPKGLPADVKAKLEAALMTALRDPEVKKKFNDIGFEVVANSPKEFAAFQAEQQAMWKQVIDEGKITPTE